jgi:lipopolysaccharide transport system permease protein
MVPVKIYTPNLVQRLGWRIWPEMLRDLVRSRELIWRLIVRDLSVRYRQSVLGYTWAILPPIVMVAVFTFLSRTRVLNIGQTSFPYVSYALWSIGIWQLFAGSLQACTNSLTSAGSLVTKINFPKEALIFGAIGQPLFDFVARLIPVTIVFIWQGVVPAWQALFLPFVFVPLLLLALGFGFVLAVANLLLRDIGNALGIVLAFGMFLAPIVYPPPVEWPFVLINTLNPFSPLLIATQDLIGSGHLSMPGTLTLACVFAFLAFFIGWRFFRTAIKRIAERA